MSVNERVKSVRNSLLMNQEEFSKKIGFKQSYLSYIESGKKNVSRKMILALRDKLNVSESWLTTGKGQMFALPIDISRRPLNEDLMTTSEKERLETSPQSIENQRGLFSNIRRFRQLLAEKHDEMAQLDDDILYILRDDNLIGDLYKSKVGSVLFYGGENKPLPKDWEGFKAAAYQTLKQVEPYKDLLHEFAEAKRKFVHGLKEIKAEIELDYDFDEDFGNERL